MRKGCRKRRPREFQALEPSFLASNANGEAAGGEGKQAQKPNKPGRLMVAESERVAREGGTDKFGWLWKVSRGGASKIWHSEGGPLNLKDCIVPRQGLREKRRSTYIKQYNPYIQAAEKPTHGPVSEIEGEKCETCRWHGVKFFWSDSFFFAFWWLFFFFFSP